MMANGGLEANKTSSSASYGSYGGTGSPLVAATVGCPLICLLWGVILGWRVGAYLGVANILYVAAIIAFRLWKKRKLTMCDPLA